MTIDMIYKWMKTGEKLDRAKGRAATVERDWEVRREFKYDREGWAEGKVQKVVRR